MLHPSPTPQATQGPDCNLNTASQHSEKHMHNEHIWSKFIQNTQFFSMFEQNTNTI